MKPLLTLLSVETLQTFYLSERQGNKQEVLASCLAHKSDSRRLLCYYYYYYFATLKGRCPQMMVSISARFLTSERHLVASLLWQRIFFCRASARLFPHLAAAPFAFVTKSPTSSLFSFFASRYRLSVKWCPLQLYLHHLLPLFPLRGWCSASACVAKSDFSERGGRKKWNSKVWAAASVWQCQKWSRALCLWRTTHIHTLATKTSLIKFLSLIWVRFGPRRILC